MYYFCRQNLFETLNMIEIEGNTTITGQYSWTDGKKFEHPIPKETLILDPAYGSNFPDFFDTTVPVMSQRLIDAFRRSGVTNFDVYPVTLKRKDTGQESEGYSAVNFIGCVDAVDPTKSEHRTRFGHPYYTGSITIDETKTTGMKAFRLLYGPGLLVVNDEVAKNLIPEKFDALLLQPTTEYHGV